MKHKEEILHIGSDVIHSKEFSLLFLQKHHRYSNIGTHTIRVTDYALDIRDRLCKYIKVDTTRLILGCLCHDLGMYGSHHKYKVWNTAWKHPVESEKIAASITDIHKKTSNMIKRHMFPLCIIPPICIEGWILTYADKVIAMKEIFGR